MNNVLFEIGVEELPARFIDQTEKQLYKRTLQWLKNHRLDHGEVITYSTPRRIAVLIKSVSAFQTSLTEEVRGPAQAIAQDDKGDWTRAAIGFTKGQNKTPDDIYIKDVKGKPYIFIKKETKGVAAKTLLKSFDAVIKSLNFPQSMRWGKESFNFSRPIRWIVALFNDEIIPFTIANVSTGNESDGHRFLGDKITITNPLEYEKLLANQFVIVNSDKREQIIQKQLNGLEKANNFKIATDESLLREVCHLVEYPTVFLGNFEQSFLSLPAEVLVTAMKEHQRYFPVLDTSGQLMPHFVGVRNGTEDHLETVIRGNEKVLYARLADAVFFYEEDQKQSIDHYLAQLERIVFQEQLGTIAMKQDRVLSLTKYLLEKLKVDQLSQRTALRAAEISKLDIPTLMVDEFPELQGIIGEKYALHYGETKEVAQTIREHYLPRHATDNMPTTQTGSIISLADKIDTIVGIIAVGLMPTGSRDPYGLRRHGNAILKILLHEGWHLSLESLIDEAIKHYELTKVISSIDNEIRKKIIGFFKQRLDYVLTEETIDQDISDAVLLGPLHSIPFLMDKARLLSRRKYDTDYQQIQEALTRVLNIVKNIKAQDKPLDIDLLKTVSERKLYDKFSKVSQAVQQAKEQLDAEDMIEIIETLSTNINEFFENNMVMDKDESIKNNRLTLLQGIAQLILSFADFRKIEWRQTKK